MVGLVSTVPFDMPVDLCRRDIAMGLEGPCHHHIKHDNNAQSLHSLIYVRLFSIQPNVILQQTASRNNSLESTNIFEGYKKKNIY